MKKLLAIVLTLVLALGASTVAMAESATPGLDYINGKGTLVLGLDATFVPMGYTDENGDIVGFDIDVAREVCARLGVELVLQPISWAAKEMELETKNIDCIWNGMSITEDRVASMAMTKAYMNNKIIVLTASDEYKTLEDLAGTEMATQTGSFAEEVVSTYEEYAALNESLGELLGYEDYMTALMDLLNGNVQSIAIDLIVANYLIDNLDEEAQLYVLAELEDDLYGVGFRKGEEDLRDKVEEVLLEMKDDGTLAKISTDWFGEDLTVVGEGLTIAADAE